MIQHNNLLFYICTSNFKKSENEKMYFLVNI